MNTFVIAEFASCHDRLLGKALRGVEMAHQMGADAYKIQWVSNPARLAERREAWDYFDAYRMISFEREWIPTIKNRCDGVGIEFMCTVYLPEDVEVVEPYVKRFKISSFEQDDLDFLNAHLKYDKPLIISQGMRGLDRTSPALEYAISGHKVDWLHCVSAYPTPIEQINLARIQGGFYDGLSDHTCHPWTGGLAVAAGARIVEFHYRLADSSPKGADYKVARDPGQAIDYVKNIRLAELMMGSPEAGIQPAEEGYVKYKVKV